MKGATPEERFPQIGTIEDPAIFFDGRDLLFCYEIAPVSDGGNAVLEFRDVIHFKKNAINVEGLRDSRYPVNAWDFTEVLESDRTEKWRVLGVRFWTISFIDTTVEVVFRAVRQIHETREPVSPHLALLGFLHTHYKLAADGR